MEDRPKCEHREKFNLTSCHITHIQVSHEPCDCGVEVIEEGRYYRCPVCLQVFSETIEIPTPENLARCKECPEVSPDAWDRFFMETL